MGVAGDFLPRVLELNGREVDLRDYQDGVQMPGRSRKRPLRIGIDVSAWIYRAGFAFGEMLMHDERHLTSYGRANLQREQGMYGLPDQSNPVSGNDEDIVAEQVRNYCEACANYVVRRLEFLKEGTNAELLVVFDGKTPPIKLATVSQRKKSREAYQNLRQDNTTAGVNVTEGTKIDDNNGNGDNTSNETTRNALNVEADIEQRVKANRRAGPGKHVSRIVNVILEKLRQRAKATEESNKDYLASWLVAPYEADSQLAYLSKISTIDLVITEDTDLVAHGCRRVLYKCLEIQTTNDKGDVNNNSTEPSEIHIDITRGKLIDFADLGGTKLFVRGSVTKPDFTDFTPIMMSVLFVLLGCDYNGHCKLKGIGLLTACRIVRKAFLESPTRPIEHESSTELSTGDVQQCIVPSSPISISSPQNHDSQRKLSALNIVWKEAYKQSYEKSSFFTEEFKREYQKSFVEALWMYRHPIVFDPITATCIHAPAQVTYNNEDPTQALGDCELLYKCSEYSELAANPIRIMQVVGEVPPTQEECISIAQGRTHSQWRLRKPTPIYENDVTDTNKDAPMDIGCAHEQISGSKIYTSMKRKSSSSSSPFHEKKLSSPAFQSKRNNRCYENTGKENHPVATLVSSTQSDRRRSLDGDEIACVAAGGFKKDDQRPKKSNQVVQSRNLFPGEVLCTNEQTSRNEELPQIPGALRNCDESTSDASAKTVPLSPTPAKSIHRGSSDHEEIVEPKSPNLLASTTPEPSTQSSSKATLSVNASGTQSSSKGTTQTLSQSQSQSSSKAGTHQTQEFATQTQWETPILQVRTANVYETPIMPAGSQSQTPNFSTQEEFFETQAPLDSFQTP